MRRRRGMGEKHLMSRSRYESGVGRLGIVAAENPAFANGLRAPAGDGDEQSKCVRPDVRVKTWFTPCRPDVRPAPRTGRAACTAPGSSRAPLFILSFWS